MTDDEISKLYNEQLYKAELEDLSFLKDTRDSENNFAEECSAQLAKLTRAHALKIHETATTLLSRGFTDAEFSRRIRFAVTLMADLIARMRHQDTAVISFTRARAERALFKAYEAFLKETNNTDWRVEWNKHADITGVGCHAEIVYCGKK